MTTFRNSQRTVLLQPTQLITQNHIEMRKTTRATFFKDSAEIDIRLPAKWEDLDDNDLRTVFEVLASDSERNWKFILFSRLCDIKVTGSEHDLFFISIPTDKGQKKCKTSPYDLAELLKCLDFVNSPGEHPVRLDHIGSRRSKAVNAQLHGVTFGDYLQIENRYQGYITSENPEAIVKVARILYPGFEDECISEAESLSILNWLVQLKALFARSFPNFFRPTAGLIDASSMLEVMNCQIRALTGGDVTKENEVFSIDCWRALTELDAKAKEAEEIRLQTQKYHN